MTPWERREPIHHGFDRKPCQVQLNDGTWVDAEIRSWDRDEHCDWSAYVMWSPGPGQGNHLGRFPAQRVRLALST